MAFSKALLTDAQIKALCIYTTGVKAEVTQAGHYVPIAVDLSAETTLGRAILTAIDADTDLHAVFSGKTQEEILATITAIGVVRPAEDVTFKAYPAATVHARVALNGEFSYFPAVQLWKSYVQGGATAVVLDVACDL